MRDPGSAKHKPGTTGTSRHKDAQGKAWHPRAALFPEPDPCFDAEMGALRAAIAKIWPLSSAHRKSLPSDIYELSQTLTSHRSELKRSYWEKPAFVSAYLYYFLPWNIIRLARLLKGLSLPKPGAGGNSNPALLDAGSGPLTLPLALWLARPQWRHLPLTVIALDKRKQPLALGTEIFTELAAACGSQPWQTRIFSGGMEMLAQAWRKTRESHGPPLQTWLISAANVINELKTSRAHINRESAAISNKHEFLPDGEMDADTAYGRLLHAWLPFWRREKNTQPWLLFAEPGTRLGGTLIMELRRAALEIGFIPVAPCPTTHACPLLTNGSKRSEYARTWCHFTFSASNAPDWLLNLSREAGLDRSSLTLAPLLLKPDSGGSQEALARKGKKGEIEARVLSRPFDIPGAPGMARYACAAPNLALLPNSRQAVSGTLVLATGADPPFRDSKSGALILQPAP